MERLDEHTIGQYVQLFAPLYTEAEVRQWLVSPQVLLGGAVPSDLIVAGRTPQVMDAIQSLLEGVYI
jgi:hypothetical protein